MPLCAVDGVPEWCLVSTGTTEAGTEAPSTTAESAPATPGSTGDVETTGTGEMQPGPGIFNEPDPDVPIPAAPGTPDAPADTVVPGNGETASTGLADGAGDPGKLPPFHCIAVQKNPRTLQQYMDCYL